ncbi:hypothetical protein [Cohnella sp. AR92]|uniref:hypothetical protein n=1 Tax=Cohnella sp. AR92 TaxID=648716 RepID=UPI000F8F7F59|nr:hypothetical protein [Cohnella sp. AR92]RUS44556.1 hypothetical protein ELR57_22500 [Cohnella sp. AR92]
MTMVLSYVWQDKIVMMADSRMSRYDKDGNFEHIDDRVKIHPSEQLVIGNSGMAKAMIRNGDTGKILEVEQLITHFFSINKGRLSTQPGKVIIGALVDTWNNTLKEKMGIKPEDHPVCFMLARWENGSKPMIYTCESIGRQVNWTSFGGAVGDPPMNPIIVPYFNEDLVNSMTFEETIQHFKRCYEEVSSKVETIGGQVRIYVLDQDPAQSQWLSQG